MSVRRLLIIGWDGAEPAVVDDMLEAGKLPHLDALKQKGVYGRIATTVPAGSLPAWTSAMTGLGPGKHGLIDFVRREPASYRLRLVTSADRSAATLPVLASQAGLKVVSLGVPGSYPPEPIQGYCIAGFDSPVATRAAARAHFPLTLHQDLKSRGLYWPYGGMDELAVNPGWHRLARKVLLQTIEQKAQVIRHVLDRDRFDLAVVVFSESDTVGHHFWAYHDPNSPRHRRNPELAGTLEEVYGALDLVIPTMRAVAEKECTVLVLSDHGMGGSSDQVVYLNRLLASVGMLHFKASSSLMGRAAGLLQDAAFRFLPPLVKQSVLRSRMAGLAMAADGLTRFGGIDLSRTRAFSDELPQNPGIWINLWGRDPQGAVEPGAEYEKTRDEIIEKLTSYRLPSSEEALFASVRRREDVLPGPHSSRAPDLLVELADRDGYRRLAAQSRGRSAPLVRKLEGLEAIGPKGVGTSGVHRPEGILCAAGPKVKGATGIKDARLVDVMPTAAALLGMEIPASLDGRPIKEIAPHAKGPAGQSADEVYSEEEQEAIRKRLEGLGYL